MRAQPKTVASRYAAGRASLAITLALLTSALSTAKCTAQPGGPILHVTVNDQTFDFEGTPPPVEVSVQASHLVAISWTATPGSFGSPVDAFRYGWDLMNPANDDEWDQNWCSTCRSANSRTFHSGYHQFFLEARDLGALYTRARIGLPIIQSSVQAISWTRIRSLYDQ